MTRHQYHQPTLLLLLLLLLLLEPAHTACPSVLPATIIVF
jgi:hypothetical protein